MDYFESVAPKTGGLCSDPQCPCPGDGTARLPLHSALGLRLPLGLPDYKGVGRQNGATREGIRPSDHSWRFRCNARFWSAKLTPGGGSSIWKLLRRMRN